MRTEREIVTDMNVVTEVDFESADWGDSITGAIPEGKTLADIDPMDRVERELLRPKFDSVAAFKLYRHSLDGGQDEDHGNAVDWHRWSAIFRDVTGSGSSHPPERPTAMLHNDSQGFISAEWYGNGSAAEEVWAALEKEWAERDRQCEGHYDTDDALTSGVGIGEAVYCDGSCQD